MKKMMEWNVTIECDERIERDENDERGKGAKGGLLISLWYWHQHWTVQLTRGQTVRCKWRCTR